MNATIFRGNTTPPIALPVAPTTAATFSFPGFSNVIITKNVSGYPGGNAGEQQQPVWYNPDPASSGGNTLTLSSNTLVALNFIRHCDGKESGAVGIVPPLPITSSSASVTGVVTITTTYPHFLKTGRNIWIFDSTDTSINGGPYSVTVAGDPTTSTTFTISKSGATGGTGGVFAINQYFGTFLENSDVDEDPAGTAGWMWLQHSTTYGGAVPFGANVRMLIDRIGGAHRFYDRVANEWLSNSADGSTIDLGFSGGVTLTRCNSTFRLGANKIVQLDTSGALGLSNPKLQFGTNGLGAGIATTNGADFLVVVNDAGDGTVKLAATFNRNEGLDVVGLVTANEVQGVQLTAQAAGNAAVVLRDTNVAGGDGDAKWLMTAEDDGGLHWLHYDGTSFTEYIVISSAGKAKISSGKLNLAGIPTSSSGLSSGDVYSNAGILTIVP